ncbi:hypothetical protein EDD37DRAFT_630021 [Exophiala viscosa]|uniref:Leucine-rich repeat-containing protein 40 n=1 Tax=Exophiala viscosa TaxID=2486360 RepID=A0AAN6DZN2_9EURO|nr:hypothetical protein EDD36DRAFT_432077 [Exophiala viscosa]KAI1624031.1 hypothetical protein EDD37DRAFT_630021 [Exophiala viscosa]
MDQDYGSNGPLRGGIPRLSRLPMPRAVASSDNLKLSARTSVVPGKHQDDLRKKTNIPLPPGPKVPLGENLNQPLRYRFGWNGKPVKPRSASPVRDALRDAQTATLDITPPNSDADSPVFEDGFENPIATTVEPETKDRRRPRPSLSERTAETLSRLTPSPSRSRRRSSIFSNDGTMPPPARSRSRLRDSRPTTPAPSRPESPAKVPFRPPGRCSPIKDVMGPPPMILPDETCTLPKAFVKGQRSKIAKPLRDPRRSTSSLDARPPEQIGWAPGSDSAQTPKQKPVYRSKAVRSQSAALKSSLPTIFRDPCPTIKIESVVSLEPRPPVAKTKPKPADRTATVVTPRPSSKRTKSISKAEQNQNNIPMIEIHPTTSPKSSPALRETIAKAKAARRKALEITVAPIEQPLNGHVAHIQSSVDETPLGNADNAHVLRTRLQTAATTGKLDIVGLGLRKIPTELMNIYKANNNTTDWYDVVDLTKINAADNEIDEIDEQFFPDFSRSDLENDDDTGNQFGGLEVLDLRRNMIQQLPIGLRRLTRLQSLELSGNKLTNGALEIICQIPDLQELMLSRNAFSGTIDMRNGSLEHLQVLDLHGNSIEGFHDEGLAQMKSLKNLNVAGNKLASLPWDVLATLTLSELNISGNQLAGILFPTRTTLTELRVLDASYNSLTGVSENDLEFPCLRSLILKGNRIARLPGLSGCSEIQALAVSENQLEEFPPDFFQLESLKIADFGHNNIKSIMTGIAGMKNLAFLNLVGNPLAQKKYLSMSTTDVKRDLEKKLDVVKEEGRVSDETPLSLNQSLFRYRYKASGGVLDLSAQSLSAIELAEIDLTDSDGPIRILKLSNNNLSVFPVELLSHPLVKYSLQLLDLSHNALLHPTDYLSSELFLPSLKSLYIVSTGLTSLDTLTTYLKAPVLAELNISCHKLAGRVPWVRAWWPTCTTLLATDNWFTSVDAEGVRGLEVLDIRNNEIETVPPKIGLLGNKPGSTAEYGRLRVLEVSGNRFRVPRLIVVEKGTEAVLKDLRRMVMAEEVPEDWKEFV